MYNSFPPLDVSNNSPRSGPKYCAHTTTFDYFYEIDQRYSYTLHSVMRGFVPKRVINHSRSSISTSTVHTYVVHVIPIQEKLCFSLILKPNYYSFHTLVNLNNSSVDRSAVHSSSQSPTGRIAMDTSLVLILLLYGERLT